MIEETNVSGDTYLEAAAPAEAEVSNTQTEQASEQSVPLSALQSERAQRQQLQDELKVIKDNLALLQTQRQEQSAPKPKEEFDGLDDGDVLTVGEAKKFIQKMNHQHQMSIEELKMTQKHSDYQEVITKYLPEVLKNNPELRKSLQQTQDYGLAYHLAKNSDSYREAHKRTRRNADAQRIVENSQSAGTLSSVGATTPISQAKRYKDMSNEEFMRVVSQNMGEI